MLLTLNPIFSCKVFKEGIAFFNNFTGNTHFLPSSFNSLIASLTKTANSKEALFALFLCDHQKKMTEQANANEEFQQFITEALKSGIIIETS